MDLIYEANDAHGKPMQKRLFPSINENTESYTYHSDLGLLSATQFTQPAIIIMEMAIVADLRARQLISPSSSFAGHSLGEYAALINLVEIMPKETAVCIGFYRGLMMQNSVERDQDGRSQFSMCAVDPSRVCKGFSGDELTELVADIATQTGCLLEVVNFNVEDQQYVCAGDLRALSCLGSVLDQVNAQAASGAVVEMDVLVRKCADRARRLPKTLKLARGKATIPLNGIDVPFHSSYLSNGVEAFRNRLYSSIPKDTLEPKTLVGKYIPNLTGKTFEISRSYFEHVLSLTDSAPIKRVLSMVCPSSYHQVSFYRDGIY